MQYCEASLGRVWVLRLEEGDRLPDTIEQFARDRGLRQGLVFYVGGAGDGSRLVVGPEEGRGDQIIPIVHTLTGAQEVLAVGTIFTNEANLSVLHLHAAVGREGDATVGCTRAGVDVWLVGEVVILEITGAEAQRRRNPKSGLELLEMVPSNP
jgi:uncharacterized protein